MKNIYKKFILVGITSLSLISCNIIDNHQRAAIETKLQDIKLSNNIRKKLGRNHGLISSYHRGGGARKIYRNIDFRRRILDVHGIIKRIEYDPNRSSYISLVVYENGDIAYVLSTEGVTIGDVIISTRSNFLSQPYHPVSRLSKTFFFIFSHVYLCSIHSFVKLYH